jgi:hypothetical protein
MKRIKPSVSKEMLIKAKDVLWDNYCFIEEIYDFPEPDFRLMSRHIFRNIPIQQFVATVEFRMDFGDH